MKKTLAAIAVLGAFAGSALATEVTLYGLVDTGLGYQHTDLDNGKDATDTFAMKSGQQSGSRFGFKGTEDLGNGLTVGFVLESQFDSDTGSLKDTFFQRESSLFLQGDFGKVAFGRIGSINNGTSSWAKMGMLSAFGTSWGYAPQAGTLFSTAGVWDNMVAYETPAFAGLKVFAQYAMGGQTYKYNDATDGQTSVTGTENESSSDRYYSIGATYNNGPVAAYLAVDSINYKSVYGKDGVAGIHAYDTDDSLTVTLGGSYNFEVVKVFLGAQYFDEVKLSSLGGLSKDNAPATEFNPSMVTGYSVGLTASIPAFGGTTMLGVGYIDAESADSQKGKDIDMTRYLVSAGYNYALSKRTNVYGVVAYTQEKFENNKTNKDVKPTATQVMVGLRHQF